LKSGFRVFFNTKFNKTAWQVFWQSFSERLNHFVPNLNGTILLACNNDQQRRVTNNTLIEKKKKTGYFSQQKNC